MDDNMPEFNRAFEESAARIRKAATQRLPTVEELKPGDLFKVLELGNYLFVCQGPHPAYPGLCAVVWCDSKGNLTIDALGLHQTLSYPVSNRDESDEVRGDRFRQWYINRNHNDQT